MFMHIQLKIVFVLCTCICLSVLGATDSSHWLTVPHVKYEYLTHDVTILIIGSNTAAPVTCTEMSIICNVVYIIII